MNHQANNGGGMAIASLVLGIIGVILCWIWYLGIPLGVLAIIFGVIARGKATPGNTGMATAGLVLGIVAVALALTIIIAAIACLGCMGLI